MGRELKRVPSTKKCSNARVTTTPRKLLDQSIERWEELYEIARSSLGKPMTQTPPSTGMVWKFGNRVVELGWRVCPLCQVFIIDGCFGCPVMDKTGLNGCVGTPYQDIIPLLKEKTSGKRAKVTRDVLRLMNSELRFLKLLLKEPKSKSIIASFSPRWR